MKLTFLALVCLAAPATAANRAELLARAAQDTTQLRDEVAELPASCRAKVSASHDRLMVAVRTAASALDDGSIGSAQGAAAQVGRELKACGGASRGPARTVGLVSRELGDALAAGPMPVPAAGPLGAVVQGLGSLFGGGMQLKGGATTEHQEHRTETSRSTRTEKVNGRPVDDDADDQEPAPRAKKQPASDRVGFGATCSRNSECESNTCYVGSGSLGFCTKMCTGDLDCPGLGFECRRPRNLNAPQSLCLQERN
jgi:hypothetical protein